MDISVIIPAYNEEKYISLAITSINAALEGVALKYQIIVVDNGSTDSTVEVANALSRVTVLTIAKSTVSAARNVGANAASGSLYYFIDADVVVPKLWGQAVNAVFLSQKASAREALFGHPYAVRENPSCIEKNWFEPLVGQQKSYLSGGNILVSREAFLKIGGFDETLVTGEDYDFCAQAKRMGIPIEINSTLSVVHLGFPSTLAHFMRRELWHGMGDFSTFNRFINSKIAIASLIFVFLVSATIGLVAIRLTNVAAGTFLVGVMIVLAFVLYKFRIKGLRNLPAQMGLASLYLLARGFSWVKYIF